MANNNFQDAQSNVQEPSDQNQQFQPFAPQESNIYIRTMADDTAKLQKGGGNFTPSMGNPQNPINLEKTWQESQPPQQMPQMPQQPVTPPNEQQPFSAPSTTFGTPFQPEDQPMGASSVENLKQRIQNLASSQPVPEANPFYSPQPPSEQPPFSPMPTQTPSNIGGEQNLSFEMPNPTIPQAGVQQPYIPQTNGNIIPEPDIPRGAFEYPAAPLAKPKKKLIPILIIALVAVVITVGYFYIWPSIIKPKVVTNPTITEPLTTIPLTPTTLPPIVTPFPNLGGDFYTSKINIDITGAPVIIDDVMKEVANLAESGTFKIIVPKIKDEYLTAKEIFFTFIKNAPEEISSNIQDKYLVYAYYGEIHPALGLVFAFDKTKSDIVSAAFLGWEKNRELVKDTAEIWAFTPKTPKLKAFKETEILGNKVRYFEYPEKEAALAYTLFDNYIIVTTSLESITSAIEHLQNGTIPVIK